MDTYSILMTKSEYTLYTLTVILKRVRLHLMDLRDILM